MDNFERILYKAMTLCDGRFEHRNLYSSIYTFTTENISGYLKYFDLKNKSLLTVGSSGDQVLNAYLCGARDITLFDINPYAKFYIYLKIAAIICLDYREFQIFFFKHGLDEYYNKMMFSKNIFDKIKSTLRLLDYESFLFFDELFNLYSSKIIRDSLFDDDEFRNKVIKNFNIYLRDEVNYIKLKNIIKSISFKYINGNIFKDKITDTFDNIFLSNLCTTTSITEFKELLKKIDENNLNMNGSMLLGYLWNTNFNSCAYQDDWSEIYKMPITRSELKDYISEYHNINDSRDFLWNEDKKNDLVLIYRKR